MAKSILSLLRGIVGSSDGTPTGTPSIAKIVNGVVSTTSTTADGLLTLIAARLLDSGAVSAAENLKKIVAEIVTNVGLRVIPWSPRTFGAIPTVQQGVPGRISKDETFAINAADDIVVHPLQDGVSWVMATGAAASATFVGKVVTLTCINTSLTTVANMQALIAANAGVAALLRIDGTAGDLFDTLYVQAETALWEEGTISAGAKMILGSDGYWWAAQGDGYGRQYVAQRGFSEVTDASRVQNIFPEWAHLIEGTTIVSLSGAAIGDGTVNIDIPFTDYHRFVFQADWTNNNVAETITPQLFMRVAGSTVWQPLGGTAAVTAIGSALGAGAQNGSGAYFSSFDIKCDELRFQYIKAGAVAGNDTLLVTFGAA